MAKSNVAKKEQPTQEPLPLAPTMEETSASFVRLSRAHSEVEDLASQLKEAKEEFKQAFESHMTIGRRFELHRSALEGAKAMDQYHEDLARAAAPASMALVPIDDGEYEVAEA